MIGLETGIEERLRRVAEARGVSAEAVLCEAVEEFLEREERRAEGTHSSGTAWPRRHAVGGIITPV